MTQHLGSGRDVLGASDEGDDIASLQLRVAKIGMLVAVAPRTILRRNTPRAPGRFANWANVFPSTSLLVT